MQWPGTVQEQTAIIDTLEADGIAERVPLDPSRGGGYAVLWRFSGGFTRKRWRRDDWEAGAIHLNREGAGYRLVMPDGAHRLVDTMEQGRVLARHHLDKHLIDDPEFRLDCQRCCGTCKHYTDELPASIDEEEHEDSIVRAAYGTCRYPVALLPDSACAALSGVYRDAAALHVMVLPHHGTGCATWSAVP